MFRTGVVGTTLLTVALLAASTTVRAQTAVSDYNDVYKVTYFANATAGNAAIRLTNPGFSKTSEFSDTGFAGWLCAMIYVFDGTENLQECCGCLLSPDGLRTITLHELTSNPGTSRTTITHGVVKVVSSEIDAYNQTEPYFPICDPRGTTASNSFGEFIFDDVEPLPTIRAWSTHLQTPFTASVRTVKTTEEEFADAGLTVGELSNLQSLCNTTQQSGRGQCGCGSGE